MTGDAAAVRAGGIAPDRRVVITALGITQILAWGSSYYLPAVLAMPSLMVMAAAPSIGSLLMGWRGPGGALGWICAAALANLLLALTLLACVRRVTKGSP